LTYSLSTRKEASLLESYAKKKKKDKKKRGIKTVLKACNANQKEVAQAKLIS
jgi:hypothetical protein